MRKAFVALGVCFALGCSGATDPSGERRLPPLHPIVTNLETPEATPPATPTPAATPTAPPPERLTTDLPHGEPPAVTPVPTATPRGGDTGSAGSVDASFGKNGHFDAFYSIDSIEEESDGAILFTGWHDGPGLKVCRLTADGDPDLSFGSSNGCTNIDLGYVASSGTQVLSHDGRIYAAGVGNARVVVRLFPDGQLDTSFGVGGLVTLPDRVWPRRLELDGDALLVSAIGDFGMLLRLSATGDLDTTFGVDGIVYLEDPLTNGPAIVRLSDGWWIAATRTKIFAFDPHGARSTTFGDGGSLTLPFWINALSADGKGALLAAGDGMAVARFSTTGALLAFYPALDPGYEVDGALRWGEARDLWVEGDGTMIMGGEYFFEDDSSMGIGRRLPDGSPDLSFGTGGAHSYGPYPGENALIVLRDGRYLLAGSWNGSGGILLRVWN